jgi:DNA-binding response OmpR family regulator
MNSTKKRILVADDDPGILDAVKLMLEEEGYIVDTTLNGRTIETLNEKFPDLLLLDIWMSGIDGRDICKKIKSQESTRNIPIIMISANRDTETIAKEAGADDFIEKPFQMDELISKIKKLIQ